MEKYTVGFLFSENRDWVVLIKKERPHWQKGLLNGVGGHIEEGETPKECFIREFEEEAGVRLPESEVSEYCTMTFKEVIVYCFRVFNSELMLDISTKTDEQVCRYEVCGLSRLKTVQSVPRLISIALD